MYDYQLSSISRHAAKPDYTARFADLEMPALFINGEKDTLVPPKVSARAAEAAPLGELHIMKNCKHWPQKERPAEYVRVADAFIRRNW